MNLTDVKYLVSGLTGRLGEAPACPACGSLEKCPADRKYFHVLMRCRTCGLTYRWPQEGAQATSDFYQHDYAEPGLTTSLPDDRTLSHLLETRFAGTEKDFSPIARLLEALGIVPPMRVLDFGANWGYFTRQMRDDGYDAVAYEISQPRAAFGKRLGIEIHTDFGTVGGPFDAVYSSHVLEHIPDPLAALKQQIEVTKRGGLVIGHTPNGSEARRLLDPQGFRSNWGLVHPVLLTDEFIDHAAGDRPYFVTSFDRPERVAQWDGSVQTVDDMSGAYLFFAIRC